MNYKKHYDLLINRSPKVKPKSGYFERHHVIPRCMGGKNGAIVYLTPEEHYVAHQLLVKIHKGTKWYYKMINAVKMMTHGVSVNRGQRSNKAYGWIKRKISESMMGDRNPMANPEHRRSHTEATVGEKNPAKRPEVRKIISQKLKDNNPMKRLELRENMRQIMRSTMWITNGIDNRRCYKSDKVPCGWRHGRYIPSKTII